MNTYKLKNYFKYKARAKNEFSLHSPFVFDLYNKVFKKKSFDKAFQDIENIRKNLQKNKEIILVNDLGAGSKVFKSNSRRIDLITKYQSKNKKYCVFLANLAGYLNCKSVLELGTSFGLSTAYLAKSNPNVKITTIEGSSAIAEKAAANFHELGLTNINLIVENFDTVLNGLIKENHFDLIYIDGNHNYKSTINYFKLIQLNCSTDTIIVFDDIYWDSEMNKAWNEIINDNHVTISIDVFEFGIVFFSKKFSKQNFILRY